MAILLFCVEDNDLIWEMRFGFSIPNLTSTVKRAWTLHQTCTWKCRTRFEALLQKQNTQSTRKPIEADLDITVVGQVTLTFHTHTHKGQLSAKCQKLEMLWGPKYRGDLLKIHGAAWIPPPRPADLTVGGSEAGPLAGDQMWWNWDYPLYTSATSPPDDSCKV